MAFFLLFLFFWPSYIACGILVFWAGIEFRLPALAAWSFNHWTMREVPRGTFFSYPREANISCLIAPISLTLYTFSQSSLLAGTLLVNSSTCWNFRLLPKIHGTSTDMRRVAKTLSCPAGTFPTECWIGEDALLLETMHPFAGVFIFWCFCRPRCFK